MTQTQDIAEGDRVYATEDIDLLDDVIPAGMEGTVFGLGACVDLLIDWDNGYATGADNGSVALCPVD